MLCRVAGLGLVTAVFFSALAPSKPAVAAPSEAAKCILAERDAARVDAVKQLGCVAAAAGKGTDIDPNCLSKAAEKLVNAFERAEEKGGCEVVGNEGEVALVVDGCVADTRSALGVTGEPLPLSTCAKSKLKGVGATLRSQINCYNKALRSGSPLDPECLTKAQARLIEKFSNAEKKPDCVQTGDASAAQAAVDACVSAILDALPDPTPPPAPEVCARWNADLADDAEGAWTGDALSCTAGSIPSSGRENYLKLVNLYRFLAGLPAVTLNAARDSSAQQCALMMLANGAISHDPPPSWDCYTSDGATAAAKSNIAGITRGVFESALDPISGFMTDQGVPDLGHRRWILNHQLGPIGVGSTNNFMCLWVQDGSGNTSRTWTAWPPPGQVPTQALRTRFGDTVDAAGWSVQSDTIDLTGASVTVLDAGNTRNVAVSSLPQFFGSRWAIRIKPMGWKSQVGHTYDVSITGIASPISYSVEVVDCGG